MRRTPAGARCQPARIGRGARRWSGEARPAAPIPSVVLRTPDASHAATSRRPMPIGTLRRSRLSSVMARPAGGDPSGPLRPAREVNSLVRSETVYPHAHRFELQARDLAIDLLRTRVDLAGKDLCLPLAVLARV